MRSPFDILAEYERRSLVHAVDLPAPGTVPDVWRGVAYRVGQRRLVSSFDEVLEIVPLPPIVPVPGAQAWLLGVGNLRGDLFPVVDLKQFMEGEPTVLHESQRVLVVRQPGGDVALTIDEIYGQRSFDAGQATEPGGMAEGRYGYFVQRAFHGDGEDWGVFALSLLARTPEFRQAAA